MISQLLSRESVSEAAFPINGPQSSSTNTVLTNALIRHILVQFVDPDCRLGITGSAPIATRRKRTAGADLRAVRNGRALELADLEEAEKKHFQPLLDRLEIVLVPLLSGHQFRPGATVFVAPGVMRQKSDFAGTQSKTA